MTTKSIRIRTSITSCLIALALLFLTPALVHAESVKVDAEGEGEAERESVVPSGINYQGLLTDALGEPVKPDGEYTLEFRLWSDPSSEDASKELVWGRAFKVVVVNGQFNVILNDAGAALAEAADHRVKSIMDAFAESKRYLGIKITSAPITNPEGETEGEATVKATMVTGEIKPRQAILSTPYAIQADNGVPVGTIVSYYGKTVPAGWLLCDGKADLTSNPEYAALLNVIKEATGENTVPDLQGYFIRGLGGDSNKMNEKQDDATAMPQKKFSTAESGNHSHTYYMPTVYEGDAYRIQRGGYTGPTASKTSESGKHTHTISGGDGETRPLNKAFNYIIKF